jgi:hypothetical protein
MHRQTDRNISTDDAALQPGVHGDEFWRLPRIS